MSATTSQAVIAASTTGYGVVGVNQAAILVAYAPPSTLAVRNTSALLTAGYAGLGVPAVSQNVMLVAYRTGTIENLNNRSWSFSLDGHTFWVLTLGEQGTFVYDEVTQQWAKWQTAGLTGWNMEIGTTWKGRVIAADQQNPVLWELTPNLFIDDDFKPQTRRMTGGLAMRNRTFVSNYAFRITASVGDVTVPLTSPATKAKVRLRFSDDQGRTFFDAGEIEVIPGKFKQELAWLSLGTMNPPQRIFEISDTGALARLDGADAEIDLE